MKILFYILFLALPFSTEAQKLSWLNSTVNFGAVGDWNSPPAVFKFKNTGNQKLMFLPQKHGREVLVNYPNRSFMPGEEGEITIQYYTGEMGPFSETVEVYSNASDRSEKLTLKGNIRSIYANALTACPSFHDEPIVRAYEPNVIQAVDAVTNIPIANAQIEVYDRGIRKAINGTNPDGVAVNWIELGKYTAVASKNGYDKVEQEIIFTKRDRTQVVYLNKTTTAPTVDEAAIAALTEDRWSEPVDEISDERFQMSEQINENVDLGIGTNDQIEETVLSSHVDGLDLGITTNEVLAEEIPKEDPTVLDLGVTTNEVFVADDRQLQITNDPSQTEEVVEAALADAEILPMDNRPPTTELREPEFSIQKFRPNNVLLLLDVSGSMKEDGKMDKLKSSIRRLVMMLREVDVLTLIAYNSDSWVVLPPVPVTDNLAIVALVDSLQPFGYTNGVKGMETAYESLRKQLIEGGNNQLIIATDGMFNSSRFSEQEAVQLVKDNSDQGIVLSIMGFGEDKEATQMMKKLASFGNGSFLQVTSGEDPTELLAEEIKTRSIISVETD